MSLSYFNYLLKKLADYRAVRTAEIDHQSVITSLNANVEFSAGYMTAIVLSNLVALLGLLTNSVAVIIGAMLISPLMGPIFTCGLAFTLGDLGLAKRAVVTIVKSVVMTIVVAAMLSLISPLNEPTHEILSRIRPNIYDLFIALFAGTAGAVALCTRKNYLITTTGVAVATGRHPAAQRCGLRSPEPASRCLPSAGFSCFSPTLSQSCSVLT
jgi:uncharacterized hydrophobic protein (TIGR00271 family)